MRKIALFVLAMTCVVAPSFAQTTQPTAPSITGGVPNPIGGVPNPISPFGVDPRRGYTATPQRGESTVFGSNGITSVVPRSDGGYTVFSPNGITSVVPHSDGGYTVFSPKGITSVVPHSDGGYTVFGNRSYDHPCFAPGYGWYPCPHGNGY
jgi:hypothetical protein